jgi:hypothetical protein
MLALPVRRIPRKPMDVQSRLPKLRCIPVSILIERRTDELTFG